MKASRQAGLSTDRCPIIAGASSRIFAAAIILFPIVAIFSPQALVLLLVATSLALLFDGRNRVGILTALPRLPILFIAALAAWSLVTVSWSPDPLTSIGLWGRVAGITLCGMLLVASARKLTQYERVKLDGAFVAAGVLFVVLFAFELVTAGILSRAAIALWKDFTPWESDMPRMSILLNRASVALAIISWLCALAIFRRYSVRWAGLFMVIVLINLFAQNVLASPVALLCGAAIFAIVYGNSRWGVTALLVALFVVNLGLFVTVSEVAQMDREEAVPLDINNSWMQRIYILDFVYDRVAERPLFGWGFDASREIGRDVVSGPRLRPGVFSTVSAIPLHPHNQWAQVWLELGLLGLLLSAGLVVTMLIRISTLHAGRSIIATAVAAATVYLLIGNLSFGMWQNWWLAIAWLCAGFLTLLVDPEGNSGCCPTARS